MSNEVFGNFDFGLTQEQEEHARKLHDNSIIIDTLFFGPCGSRSFTEEMIDSLKNEFDQHRNAFRSLGSSLMLPVRLAIKGELPEFKECWDASGITAGNAQIPGNASDDDIEVFGLIQSEVDHLPWIIKALKADDIRRAKAENKHAVFINTQIATSMTLNPSRLDHYYDLGMRMIQLTYNNVNLIGGGCTERVDCGVTNFGAGFIKRMNKLGILVDTGHCGRQTTLDACAISDAPVIASHTSAQGQYFHDRGKSDEEIRAIAASGGYIGIFCVGFFLTDSPDPTVESVLDHIDYVSQLVGPQYVGIGSDWPMQVPAWGLDRLTDFALANGFRREHGIGSLKNLIGFDDYRDFPNITRGLVKRGYSDEEITGILGGNFLRVFEAVCG